MIAIDVRPRQTDGQTDRRMDRRTKIMAIARRFVPTNASRPKMHWHAYRR